MHCFILLISLSKFEYLYVHQILVSFLQKKPVIHITGIKRLENVQADLNITL